MQAYHGSEERRGAVLALVQQHEDQDKIAQGHGYWEDGRGCAVGCTLESLRQLEGIAHINHSDHGLYESLIGVPPMLARIEDGLFESLPDGEWQTWPRRFLAAIPVGADLSLVASRFLHWLLVDPTDG